LLLGNFQVKYVLKTLL